VSVDWTDGESRESLTPRHRATRVFAIASDTSQLEQLAGVILYDIFLVITA